MQFTEQSKRTRVYYFYVTVESIHADLLSCHYKSKFKNNQDFCKKFYHLCLRHLQTQETSLDMQIINFFTLTKPTRKRTFFSVFKQWNIPTGFIFVVVFTYIYMHTHIHTQLILAEVKKVQSTLVQAQYKYTAKENLCPKVRTIFQLTHPRTQDSLKLFIYKTIRFW